LVVVDDDDDDVESLFNSGIFGLVLRRRRKAREGCGQREREKRDN
jgi:hypothetical protein